MPNVQGESPSWSSSELCCLQLMQAKLRSAWSFKLPLFYPHSCFCNIWATTYQLPHRETRRGVTTGVSNTQETTPVHDGPSQQCAHCVALIVLSGNKGSFDLGQFLNIPTHDIVDKCMTQHDSSVDFEQRRKPVFMCGNKHCSESDYVLLAALNNTSSWGWRAHRLTNSWISKGSSDLKSVSIFPGYQRSFASVRLRQAQVVN